MKNYLIKIGISLGLASGLLHAQTCELDWAATNACLNLSEIDGDTISVASNVTHFGDGGPVLCPIKKNKPEVPAVIFAVDQSVSMLPTYGGDPYFYRATAVRNALKDLHSINPDAWFGFAEFTYDVLSPISTNQNGCGSYGSLNAGATHFVSQSFIPLDTNNYPLWTDASKSPIQNRCAYGTDYYTVLTEMKKHMFNFDTTKVTPKFSVVFISDGDSEDSDRKTLWTPLDSNFKIPGKYPKVYGLYLGNTIGADLDTLSMLTGGTTFHVNSKDTNGVKKIMSAIIDSTTKLDIPDSVIMNVNGVNYKTNVLAQQGNAYPIQVPNDIPLQSGNNAVRMTIFYANNITGALRSDTVHFVVKGSNPVAPAGITSVGGGVFNQVCVPANSLTVNGLVNPKLGATSLASLPWISSLSVNSLQLALNTPAFVGTNAQVRITSKRTGDVLNTTLSSATMSSNFTGAASLSYVGMDSQGKALAGNAFDAQLQVALFDTLQLTWKNPNDSRDSIVASVVLYQKPTLEFSSDTLVENTIGVNLHDVALLGSTVKLGVAWLGEGVSDSISIARSGASAYFTGNADLQSFIGTRTSGNIVVSYMDPLFKTLVLDTVFYKSGMNQLTVNGIQNPTLAGNSLSEIAWVSSDTLQTLNVELNSQYFLGTNANVRITSARTGDAIVTTLTSLTSGGAFKGVLPVTLVSGDASGKPVQGDATDGIFHVAPFDTLQFTWVNPNKATDVITGSLLLYRKPTLAFGSDSLTLGQITASLQDVALDSNQAHLNLVWLGQTDIMSTILNRDGTAWDFSGKVDSTDISSVKSSDRLIIQYKDPLFHTLYSDTLKIIFHEPVLPVARMLDENGDGRADKLVLTYQTARPAGQVLQSLRVVWGMGKDAKDSQDTLVLMADELDLNLSDDVWNIEFTKPLTFGHTSGAGKNGEGELTVRSVYEGRTIDRMVPIVDQVGPVILMAWVDGKDKNKTYLRASEPLGAVASMNWVLNRKPYAMELPMVSAQMPSTSDIGVSTLILKEEANNQILGGDSLRFLVAEFEGVRDVAGNAAHENNPFVQVQGTRDAPLMISAAFEQPLISDKVRVQVPYSWQKSVAKEEFRVLAPTATGFKVHGTSEIVDKTVIQSMPTLGIKVDLPELHGLDANGVPHKGLLIDGKFAFENTVKVETYFYDHLGQFIALKKAKVEVNNLEDITAEGSVELGLVWQRNPNEEIKDHKNRSVGTGVIVAKTIVVVESKATQNIDIYDADGNLMEESMKQGDVKINHLDFVTRIGYKRN